MSKKGDKKKTNRSYADENPLNPRFSKWGGKKKKSYADENPYKGKKKNKKASKKTGK